MFHSTEGVLFTDYIEEFNKLKILLGKEKIMTKVRLFLVFVLIFSLTSCKNNENKKMQDTLSSSPKSTTITNYTNKPTINSTGSPLIDLTPSSNNNQLNKNDVLEDSNLTKDKIILISRNEANLDIINSVDLSKLELCFLGKEYLASSYEEFTSKYKDDSLNELGIKQDSSLRFTSRYKDKVIGDISLSISVDDVIDKLGKPSFSDKENNLIGYKTDNYYITFHGNPSIDEISVTKRTTMPREYKNMLVDFMSIIKNKDDYEGYEEFLEKYSQQYSKFHIRGGGWNARYSFGINFEIFDGISVDVYNDFEGNLTKSTPTVSIEYINNDSVFLREKEHYSWETYLAKEFKEKGVLSPNKKVLAYSDNNSLYEHAKIHIKFLDNIKADKYLSVGYFTDNLIWLNDKYILFSADYKGIFVYNIYKEVWDYEEITKKFDSDKDDFRKYQFISADTNSIKYLDENNNPVTLAYSFDKDDKIIIKKVN